MPLAGATHNEVLKSQLGHVRHQYYFIIYLLKIQARGYAVTLTELEHKRVGKQKTFK